MVKIHGRDIRTLTLKEVRDYIQGTVRFFIYKHCPFLIRRHIKEQYVARLVWANKCLDNKSCVGCGCETPALFFASRACSLSKYEDRSLRVLLAGRSEICYPAFMGRKSWEKFKKVRLKHFTDDKSKYIRIIKSIENIK